MAAAGYAFLVSLLNTMDQIQLHSRLSTCFDAFQFQSLREKVGFLVDFVENHSHAFVGEDIDADITEGEALLSRIAVLAQIAEDKIEVEAAHRIRDRSTEKTPSFLHDLEKIIHTMDSIIKEEVMKMKEEMRIVDRQHTSAMDPPPSSSSSSSTSKKTTAVVGFNGYLERMLDELTGYHSGRRILPIVGMGGIGKTTLARIAYEHSHALHHFDVRVWVTVSQTFSAADILSQALSCLGESTSALVDDHDLGDKLRKTLYGRRYLIVLDDVWSVKAWERIQLFFPENCNSSRIVVTTRQGEVVDYFGSSALFVNFLNESDSWELFCGKAFAGEDCPPELEEIGRMIVKKCIGFPLAIGVIGGLLSKSPRTKKYWKEMEKDKSLVLEKSEEGNKALGILYSSYKHLPACLKPCFLHLGLFPEDHKIDPCFLVSLWIAEGFIKPNKCQSLEQAAESYIKELVDRNLLLVASLRRDKQVEFYHVHDLVRELCTRVGEKEQFYCVQRDIDGMFQFIVDERTARFYPRSKYLTFSERPSVMTPMIFHGQRAAPFKSRLLRVLVDYTNFLARPFQLVSLRFLAKTISSPVVAGPVPTWKFPSSISLCWSLQTIILDKLNLQIWTMPHLRHIEIVLMHIPNCPSYEYSLVLHNLQKLGKVKNLNFSEEVCKRIPNIKELSVEYDLNEQGGCFNYLNKLESLEYRISGGGGSVQGLKLPSSLKNLRIMNCHLVQSDMAMIALLPHLESLLLNGIKRVNTTWDCVEGEFVFVSLKHLSIDRWFELENWVADSSNFPVLETLELRSLCGLKEVPSSFEEIPTLERFDLVACSDSAMTSAINIQREHESLGNLGFQVTLTVFDRSKAQYWRAKIKELGITCQNIHVRP